MRKWLFVALCLGASSLASAQLAPRPIQPVLRSPTPTIAPLTFESVPSGTVYVPIAEGTGPASAPNIPLLVKTKGGKGTVTLSLTVEGIRSQDFSLVDPPARQTIINTQLATPTGSGVSQINLEAASVSKMIRSRGLGGLPRSIPEPHRVTVVARDSSGAEVKANFTIALTIASGKPQIVKRGNPTRVEGVNRYPGITEAQLAVAPHGEVITVLYNVVRVGSQNGGDISWHARDPESEVICKYGSFRYACEIDVGMFSPLDAVPELPIRVPNIGRGENVEIILKGPYGESAPIPFTIDSKFTALHRRSVPTATLGGKHSWKAAPAFEDDIYLKNAGTRRCGERWLVWDNVDASGRVFRSTPAGAIPINIGLAGEMKNRLISVPKGQRITTSPSSWAAFESDVPPGITNFYVQDIAFSYFTVEGECPDRRR